MSSDPIADAKAWLDYIDQAALINEKHKNSIMDNHLADGAVVLNGLATSAIIKAMSQGGQSPLAMAGLAGTTGS